MTTIINPDFDIVNIDQMHLINALKCNYSRDVDHVIHVGVKYVIEFPDAKEIINVVCDHKLEGVSYFKILSHFIHKSEINEDVGYHISYPHDSFDAIYFESFDYKQNCNLYVSMNDLVMRT
jgi:hypothetical protein